MAYLGSGMEEVEKTVATVNMVCDTMVGDGSTTTMTIGATQEVPGSVNNVSVYFDGVCQRPTTDYTLSYKTVTFTTAPENAVKVTCLSYANEFLDVISDATVYSTGIEDNAVTAAKLGSTIASSKLTGTLPALDGSALTGVGVTPITTSASDPLVTTNPSGGLGTVWANTTSGEMYVLTDATAGSNLWTNIGTGEGHVYTYGGTVAGFAVGGYGSGPLLNSIDKFDFSSNTTASDHGDLVQAASSSAAASSRTHGYCAGGGTTPNTDMIQKYPFATASGSTDQGNLTSARRATRGVNSNTHGLACGGYTTAHVDTIDRYAYSSNADAIDHGNLSSVRSNQSSTGSSSLTHGYIAGGSTTHPVAISQIDKISFTSNTTASDHGDISPVMQYSSGHSSSTHGYNVGGYGTLPANPVATIEKYSFSSTGTSTDHGNLSTVKAHHSVSSSTTHGYTAGGNNASPYQVIIDKYAFASNTTAASHGNLSGMRAFGAGHQY